MRSRPTKYANKIMEVVELIKEKHIKKVTGRRWSSGPSSGLYRRIDEPVPTEIEAKLKNAKDLDDEKLTVLLAEVRQLLGKREDLDKHKDIDFTLQHDAAQPRSVHDLHRSRNSSNASSRRRRASSPASASRSARTTSATSCWS